VTVSEEIAKLHELHSRGALSAEEFARAKARLLGTEPIPPSSFPVNRLRRSLTDSWIGGVCGGLGRLTGLESWIWRIIFVFGLAFGGFTLFAYIILWIFVPREGS
jgi:phage shock protein PspC (stress-responsive transcriptional regulator)